uniref:Uncharacterized protein n=1 Tax=Aegilops tauschii TaxID=37682 RepID=M8BER9_AEGTA
MTAEPVPVPVAPVSAAEKRRRRPSSGSSSWKPTLVAISEDAAVAAAKADAGKAKGKPKGKPAAAKAKARASPRALRPDYDDFRTYGTGTHFHVTASSSKYIVSPKSYLSEKIALTKSRIRSYTGGNYV